MTLLKKKKKKMFHSIIKQLHFNFYYMFAVFKNKNIFNKHTHK